MARAPRNYKSEYKNYHSKPAQKANRAARGRARYAVAKSGTNVKGKDVAHRNGNPRDNRPSNLTTQRPSRNRSFARTTTARKRNPRA